MSPKPLTTHPDLQRVVFKNRWREIFDGNVPAGWEPSMSVSVIVPAFNSATLDLTLASLAAQDYPEDLVEVIVVDDGSEPPVTLGTRVHPHTRVIRLDDPDRLGWGRANATHRAIAESTGDIIYWVDSDMVLFRDNIRRHAVWAHFIPEAATIGYKGFVESWEQFDPESVYQGVLDGSIADHWDPATLHRHWSQDIFEETDDLNDSDGRNYATHMGATASVTRLVYERTHGTDPRLRAGEDTEIAYQIWQAGGVFIPVDGSLAWHLGRGTVQDQSDAVAHHNKPYFAQRMPIPRYRRTAANRRWEVPLIRVVVEVDHSSAAVARDCVDLLLNSSESDLTVDLVGPWSELDGGRRRILADPRAEMYLLQEWFRGEPRVNLVETAPSSVFPSPYRVDVPPAVGLPPRAMRAILRRIDGRRLGKVSFLTPHSEVNGTVTAWSTAALTRASHYVSDDVSLDEALDATWGVEWWKGSELGLVDLRERPAPERIYRAHDEVKDLEAKVAEVESQRRAAESQLAKERRVGESAVRHTVRRDFRRARGVAARAARRVATRLRGPRNPAGD